MINEIPYHKHTGIDSPKINESDLISSEDLSAYPFTNLTAGEALSAGDVVCFDTDVVSVYSTKSAYVFQRTGGPSTTNYGSETLLYAGLDTSGFAYVSLIEFDMSSVPAVKDILKAELVLNATGIPGGQVTGCSLARVSATWAEGTVTFATKPTVVSDVNSVYLSEESFDVTDGGATITLDVTQIVRHWKDGNVANYGFQVGGGGTAGRYFTFHSDDATNSSNRPRLDIYRRIGSTGSRVIKADASEYITSRAIGVCETAVGAESPARINYALAGIGNASYIGGTFYLSETAGGVVYTPVGLDRVVSLGRVLTSSRSLINIQLNDVLVESYTPNAQANRRIYVPDDVRYANIYFFVDAAADEYFVVKADRAEAAVSGAANWFKYEWGSNYIDITSSSNLYIKEVYFYT
jgi:hypothetical protein